MKNARKMCADALSLAETVKNQLRNQFTEELKVFKIRQEREKAEEEARKAKEEMWKMEAERRRLEAESEAAQREIDEMNEESRRQQAEAERQELIRIYGDPDKILQEAIASTSRPPPPPSTEPEKADEKTRKEERSMMEAERRRLEAKSEAIQQEIEGMNEESRRQQAEAETKELSSLGYLRLAIFASLASLGRTINTLLIRIYGDPHKIVQEVTAPTSRPPTPPPTVPEEPTIESLHQLKDKEDETVLSNESGEKECNICFEPFDSDRRRVMCFFPCGHARTCQDCFNSFKGRKECPECRKEIEQATVAFF